MNPVLKWGSILATIVPMILGSISAIVYFYRDDVLNQQWYKDDVEWNRKIIQRQIEIEELLADLIPEVEAFRTDMMLLDNRMMHLRLGVARLERDIGFTSGFIEGSHRDEAPDRLP